MPADEPKRHWVAVAVAVQHIAEAAVIIFALHSCVQCHRADAEKEIANARR